MAQPRYKVIVADSAKTMLGAHIKFLAQVSANAARETRTRLLTAIRSLGSIPERFPFLDEEHMPKNKYHKMFVYDYYLVLYQVKDQIVYVDYIVDCRQDYGWMIR